MARCNVETANTRRAATYEFSQSQPVSSAFTNHVGADAGDNNREGSDGQSHKRSITEDVALHRQQPVFSNMTREVANEIVEVVFKDYPLDRLSFAEFRRVVLADLQLMGWFECLGTVF